MLMPIMNFREIFFYLILLLVSLFKVHVVDPLPVSVNPETKPLMNTSISHQSDPLKIIKHGRNKTQRLKPDSTCIRTNRFFNMYRDRTLNKAKVSDVPLLDLSHEKISANANQNLPDVIITNTSQSSNLKPVSLYERHFGRNYDPFHDKVGRVFQKVSKYNNNPLNPAVYSEASNENDRLYESSLMLQQHFLHVIQCMNLCIDIENEFLLQEHLFKRNEGSESHIKDLDHKFLSSTAIENEDNLETRLEKYINMANLCFGKDKQDIKLVSERVRENLEIDLLDLLVYLRTNYMNDEHKNLKIYFNTVHNILTENSAIEKW